MFTFGSLFAGIGGIDLGLERAGMECRWQVEIDNYCNKVLEKHWPEVKRYGDIREIKEGELEKVDLICGGFPCQDISTARPTKQPGICGPCSGLFYEMARIISETKPKYVLIENVPAITRHGLDSVGQELRVRGYTPLRPLLIEAKAFGSSIKRERIFIIAISTSSGWRDDIQTSAYNYIKTDQPAWEDTETLIQTYRNESEYEGNPEDIRVGDGVPDWVDRLKSLGNAVVPQVAEYLGGLILAVDDQGKPPRSQSKGFVIGSGLNRDRGGE